jgi:lysyl-tRNA synthetase class 2
MIQTFNPASSNILTVQYDTDTKEMQITFVSGDVYTYAQVPQDIYAAFSHAPSAGSFFYRFIRDRYAYTQV